MEERYALGYKDLFERHWWWRARERVLVTELDRRLGAAAGRSLLDVGCGDGLFFPALERFGTVEGVEADVRLVDPQGPRRSRIHVGPFDESFRPAKRYDVILMLDVLEHFRDREPPLRRALELLEDDGLLIVTVPAFMALWTSHDDLNHHYVRFTRPGFAALARAAGMRLDAIRYLFRWTVPVKLALRLGERLAPRPPVPERVPPAWLNRALYTLSRAEELTLGRLPLPFGSSLLAVGGRLPQRPKCRAAFPLM